jgi:transcriptional regulator with XRE-family HTH domain
MNYREPEPKERQRIAEEGQLLIGILLLLMPNGSRKALAARSGVSRRALSLYERGLRRPQQRTRLRLAEAVNVDLATIEALFPTFERLRSPVGSGGWAGVGWPGSRLWLRVSARRSGRG